MNANVPNYIKLFETFTAQKELEGLTDLVLKKVAKETFKYHEENVWSEPKDWKSKPHLTEGRIFKIVDIKGDYEDIAEGDIVKIKKNSGAQIMFYDNFDDMGNDTVLASDVTLEWSKLNNTIFEKFAGTTVSWVVDDKETNSNKKFDELSKFIENTSVSIRFKEKERDTKGHLSYTKDINHLMTITLFYEKNIFNKLKVGKREALRLSDTYTYKDLYFNIFHSFYDTLLHELQHAYDLYRSKGRAFDSQMKKDDYKDRWSKRDDIIRKKKTEELKEEEIEFLNKLSKEYLNFPHEINARFTQAVKETHFSEIDFKEDEDGDLYSVEFMKPIREVVEKFKKQFYGWRHLSDKNKKRLIRKVSQFWHLYKEEIDNKKKSK